MECTRPAWEDLISRRGAHKYIGLLDLMLRHDEVDCGEDSTKTLDFHQSSLETTDSTRLRFIPNAIM
jgi:hypothetical protein